MLDHSAPRQNAIEEKAQGDNRGAKQGREQADRHECSEL
jgi:hypothetical protein